MNPREVVWWGNARRTSYALRRPVSTTGRPTILENEIPDLGLVTNEGLRDVLKIGDQTRPELYNLQTDKPTPPLVPRYLRKEIPGRVDSQGNIVDRLDEDAVEVAVEDFVEEDIDSIVVSMLFSYLDASQEERVGELIEELAPEMDMETVIIPRNPGVFSARGLLIADIRVDESHAYRSDDLDADEIQTQLDELETDLADRLRDQGFGPDEAQINCSVDVRYKGQAYELTVANGVERGVRKFR